MVEISAKKCIYGSCGRFLKRCDCSNPFFSCDFNHPIYSMSSKMIPLEGRKRIEENESTTGSAEIEVEEI